MSDFFRLLFGSVSRHCLCTFAGMFVIPPSAFLAVHLLVFGIISPISDAKPFRVVSPSLSHFDSSAFLALLREVPTFGDHPSSCSFCKRVPSLAYTLDVMGFSSDVLGVGDNLQVIRVNAHGISTQMICNKSIGYWSYKSLIRGPMNFLQTSINMDACIPFLVWFCGHPVPAPPNSVYTYSIQYELLAENIVSSPHFPNITYSYGLVPC